jgi:hypothetical protein
MLIFASVQDDASAAVTISNPLQGFAFCSCADDHRCSCHHRRVSCPIWSVYLIASVPAFNAEFLLMLESWEAAVGFTGRAGENPQAIEVARHSSASPPSAKIANNHHALGFVSSTRMCAASLRSPQKYRTALVLKHVRHTKRPSRHRSPDGQQRSVAPYPRRASHRKSDSMAGPLTALAQASRIVRRNAIIGVDVGRGDDRASSEGNGKVCRFVLSDLTKILERGKP